MAKLLQSVLRRTAFRKKGNLLSLDDPYQALADLLHDHEISGILDAGASTGRVSRRLLKRFPNATAYAFEPQPMYHDMLETLAAEDSRISPQFLALGSQPGTAELQLTESPGSTSLFKPSKRMQEMYPDQSAVKETVTVEVTTIDDWRGKMGSPAIELMKLDIQGGELAALQGAQQTLRDTVLAVYTEILFNPLYDGGALYSEIDLCLRDAGFTLFNMYKPRTDDNGMLMWANAIFLNAARMRL